MFSSQPILDRGYFYHSGSYPSNQIKSLRPPHRLHHRADAQRTPDIVPVGTDGMDGEVEVAGDVFVFEVPANEREYFPLAF